MQDRIKQLIQHFEIRYGTDSASPRVFFAPGRVNLIGEHTDYNGGYVLPCALQYGTLLVVRFNEIKHLRLASLNFSYSADIPVAEASIKRGQEWINYPLGVIQQFNHAIPDLRGMDMLYEGDIPNGAGLSSSASIEMTTAFAINELFGLKWDMLSLIKASRKAENDFVGVSCGIMDQYAVGNGKKDHAIFLNCDTVEHQLIPLKLNGYSLMISNTNKKRTLADSKYNERVDQCGQAVRYLRGFLDIRNLGQVTLTDFEKFQQEIPDEIIRKRARHVISENNRVLHAVQAMHNNDLLTLGMLMNQSHDSLRHDYEVTGFELDTLVTAARSVPGIIGSRMTGAGFGGCTVSILRQDQIDRFQNEAGEKYHQETGLIPSFYLADIGDGVVEIKTG
ncbi:MAG: galactokinase [Bacteroidales bacterium]|nr:galactokinase [Lentimicrobiaceae bacterium]MDD5694597.1 galactokinase [Bacteroidales bacterium]